MNICDIANRLQGVGYDMSLNARLDEILAKKDYSNAKISECLNLLDDARAMSLNKKRPKNSG
jgi:hypothetical protein